MLLSESIKSYRVELLLVFGLMAFTYWTIVTGMVSDWYHDDNYSHGFLIPVIAVWFLNKDWNRTKEILCKPTNLGLLVVLLGVGQLVIAWLGTEYFNMRLSMLVVLCGIVLYLFGVEVLKQLSLPLGYLVLMIPIPYLLYDAVAFPLKLFVARVSVLSLKLLGLPVLRDGNIITFPNIVLEVADACSGMRSLMSLIALAVTLAFILIKSPWLRILLIALSIPYAVVTNAFRVIVTGLLAHGIGREAAEGFFHEFAGMAVFGVAMVLLCSTGFFLRYIEVRRAA